MSLFSKNGCEAFFNHWAPDYDRTLEGYRYRIPEALFAAVWPNLENKPGVIRLLDLGIGTGLCSQPFRQTGRVHITGIDRAAQMLEECKRKGIADEVVTGNLQELLPFPNNDFDCVIAGGVLEFISDPAVIFSEVVRVLKPGGIFAVTGETPETRHLYRPGLFAGVIRDTPHRVVVRRFFRSGLWPRGYRKYLYSREALDEYLFEAGLNSLQGIYITAYQWSEDRKVKYYLSVSCSE